METTSIHKLSVANMNSIHVLERDLPIIIPLTHYLVVLHYFIMPLLIISKYLNWLHLCPNLKCNSIVRLSFNVFSNIPNHEMTPLSMAIVHNRSDLVLDLIAAGADTNYVNNDGWVFFSH